MKGICRSEESFQPVASFTSLRPAILSELDSMIRNGLVNVSILVAFGLSVANWRMKVSIQTSVARHDQQKRCYLLSIIIRGFPISCADVSYVYII